MKQQRPLRLGHKNNPGSLIKTLGRRAGTLATALALLGCSTVGGHEPKAADRAPAPGLPVTVYAHGMHTLVALPAQATATGKPEEWAYGERIWFYEDRITMPERLQESWYRFRSVFRCLFWPNHGVIERVRADHPYPERPETDASDEIRCWSLTMTPEGAAQMRAWLEASRASLSPIYRDRSSIYYPATRRYDALYTCNQYVAQALKAGGLPVKPTLCLLPQGLWWQLNDLATSTTVVQAHPLETAAMPAATTATVQTAKP